MNAYLLPGLAAGPTVIGKLVDLLPAANYDRPLVEGRFTPREVVAHLADWEPIMRDRIRIAVESPGSTIPSYDEGQMAIDHKYAESDIREQGRIFAAERAKTAEYVKSLTDAQLAQSVVHPERGPQSGHDLAGMLLGHDMYHVEQLCAYLG